MDRQLSRYPIVPYRTGYRLTDSAGRQISFHRTVSGALRARRVLVADDNERKAGA